MNASEVLNKTFNLKLGQDNIEPTYWQAAAIIFLIFLLVLTLARLRHMYISWSLGKSSVAMIFWGFLLALIVEGLLLIGGRTLLTETLGWKNAPKPISTALEAGRAKLVNVLGVKDEVPATEETERPTYRSVVSDFQSLSPKEADKARLFICEP